MYHLHSLNRNKLTRKHPPKNTSDFQRIKLCAQVVSVLGLGWLPRTGGAGAQCVGGVGRLAISKVDASRLNVETDQATHVEATIPRR